MLLETDELHHKERLAVTTAIRDSCPAVETAWLEIAWVLKIKGKRVRKVGKKGGQIREASVRRNCSCTLKTF